MPRRSTIIFLLVTVVVLTFAVNTVWTLLSLLVVSGAEDAIHRADLPAVDKTWSASNSNHRTPPDLSGIGDIASSPKAQPRAGELIPRILHQTYKNNTIPTIWREAQQSCLDLHPDYEYILWTDESARAFIKEHYVWFLETFDGYKHPIQRADALRYFVLDHYGGIYIDLDDGCNRPLDPLLKYPAWVRKTVPTGISNDAMAAYPGHPFFAKVLKSLDKYNRSWLLSYITVMASTGPLFLSIIWRHYNSARAPPLPTDPGLTGGALDTLSTYEKGRVYILMPQEYQKQPWSFFTHHKGDSWHEGDAQLMFWSAKHWLLLTVIGFGIGFSILGAIYWIMNRYSPSRSMGKDAEKKRRFRSRHGGGGGVSGLLSRLFGGRGEGRGDYELLERRDV